MSRLGPLDVNTVRGWERGFVWEGGKDEGGSTKNTCHFKVAVTIIGRDRYISQCKWVKLT